MASKKKNTPGIGAAARALSTAQSGNTATQKPNTAKKTDKPGAAATSIASGVQAMTGGPKKTNGAYRAQQAMLGKQGAKKNTNAPVISSANNRVGFASLKPGSTASSTAYSIDNNVREAKKFTPYTYRTTKIPNQFGMSYDSQFDDDYANTMINEDSAIYDKYETDKSKLTSQEWAQLAFNSVIGKAGTNYYGMSSTGKAATAMQPGGGGVLSAGVNTILGNDKNALYQFNTNKNARITEYVKGFINSDPTDEEFDEVINHITGEIDTANQTGESNYAIYMQDLLDEIMETGANKGNKTALRYMLEKEQGKLSEEAAKDAAIAAKYEPGAGTAGPANPVNEARLKELQSRAANGEVLTYEEAEELMDLMDTRNKIAAEQDAQYRADAESYGVGQRRAQANIDRYTKKLDQETAYEENMSVIDDEDTDAVVSEYVANIPEYEVKGKGIDGEIAVANNAATRDQMIFDPLDVLQKIEDAQHIDGGKLRDDVYTGTDAIIAECALFMTQDERTAYFLLAAEDKPNGTDKAGEFFDLLKDRTLLKRRAEAAEEIVAKGYKDSNWFKKAVGNAATIPVKLLGQIVSAGAGALGEYNAYDPMNDYMRMVGAYRNETRSELHAADEKLFYNNEKIPQWTKDVVNFITNGQGLLTGMYDDAMSIGDNAFRGMLTGGMLRDGVPKNIFDIINNGIMGVTSFGEACFNNAEKVENGEWTYEEYMMHNICEGLNEVLQETIFDKFEWNADIRNVKDGKSAFEYIWKSGMDEAFEEFAGAWMDVGFDQMISRINGGETQWAATVKDYMENGGYTESEANVMAALEFMICNPVAAAGSGFVTGIGMSGPSAFAQVYRETMKARKTGAKIGENGPVAVNRTIQAARSSGDEAQIANADEYEQMLIDAGIEDIEAYDEETMRMYDEQQKQEKANTEQEGADQNAETGNQADADTETTADETKGETDVQSDDTGENAVTEDETSGEEQTGSETVNEEASEEAAEETKAEEAKDDRTAEQKMLDETMDAYEQGMKDLDTLERQLADAEQRAADTSIEMDSNGEYSADAIAAAAATGEELQNIRDKISAQQEKNEALKENLMLAREANLQARKKAGEVEIARVDARNAEEAARAEQSAEETETVSDENKNDDRTITPERRAAAVKNIEKVQKALDKLMESKKNQQKLGRIYLDALETMGANVTDVAGGEARKRIARALGGENVKSGVVLDALTNIATGIATSDDLDIVYADIIRDIKAGNSNLLSMVVMDMIERQNSGTMNGTFTRYGEHSDYSREAQERMKLYEQLYAAGNDGYNAVITKQQGNDAKKDQFTVHGSKGDTVVNATGRFKISDNGLMAQVTNASNGDTFYTPFETVAGIDEEQAGVMNAIRTFSGENAADAEAMWSGYTASGMNSESFGEMLHSAYQYGRAGMSETKMLKAIGANAKTEAAIKTAYASGKESAKTRNTRAANMAKGTARGGRYSAVINGNSYDLTKNEDIDRLSEDLVLNKNQRAALRLFGNFAKTRSVNIELFESKANDQGIIEDDNGTYENDTNTIRIDINAGMDKTGEEFLKKAMARVFSHELTHFIQANNDVGYRALTSAVMQALNDNGYSFNKLVNAQIQNIVKENKDGTKKTDQEIYDEAVDEVVANACEMMLKDSNIAEDIANEVAKSDRTLAQRILDFIKEFLNDIKEAFKDVKEDSNEAKILAKNREAFEKVRDIWTQALKDAINGSGTNAEASATPAARGIDSAKANEDGIAVGRNIAREMDSDRVEDPNKRESIRSTVAWRRAHMENYPNDMSFEQISSLMEQFDQKILQSDVLRMAVPHGIVNDVTTARDAQSVVGAKREGSDEKFGKSNIGPLRSNEEYGFTFDLDTKCERTYNYLYLRNNIQNMLGRQLTSFEARQLIELMRADGRYMIPCTYCYVEGKRMMLADGYVRTIAKESKKSIGRKVSPSEVFNAVEATRTIVSGWMDDRFNKPENYTVDRKTEVRDANGKVTFEGYRDFWMPAGVKVADLVREICEDYNIPYVEKQPKEVTDAYSKEEKAAYKFKFGAQRVIENSINEWIYNHKLDVPMNLADTTTDWRTGSIDYQLLNMHSRGVIAAQGGVKANVVKNYKPYTDELSRVTAKEREHMNAMGGARIHSSNDFQVGNLQDYLLFFSDLSAGRSKGEGWYVHTYSKNLTFADIFSRFNARINCSVAFYTDRNGKVVANEDEGCNQEQLKKLRERNKNIGAMAMVVDNAQLAHALNEDWVDMIIPFHASGMPAEMFYDVMGWQNYTAIQGEKEYSSDAMKARIKAKLGKDTKVTGNKAAVEAMFWKTFNKITGKNVPTTAAEVDKLIGSDSIIRLTKKNSKGKEVEYCPHFFPYDSTDSAGNFVPGHHNDAERYKALCELYGGIPRFQGLQIYDKAQDKMVDVTDHTNYVKLIKEAARTDSEQEYISMDDIEKPSDEEGKSAWDKINEAMETFNGYGGFNQDPGDLQHRFVRDYVGENGEPIIGTAKDVISGKAKFTVGEFVDIDREKSDRNKAISDGYYEQRQERMNGLIETVYEAEQVDDSKERKKIMDTHNVAANPVKSQGNVSNVRKLARNTDQYTHIKDQIKDHIEELNNMDPVFESAVSIPAHEYKSDLIDWVLNHYDDEVVHRDGFGDVIHLWRSEIKHTLRYLNTDGEISAFIAIPYVIRSGINIGYHSDHKGNGYTTYTFGGPVVINGVRGNLAVVVKQTSKYKYHTHRIITPDGSFYEFIEKNGTEDGHQQDTVNSSTSENIGSVSDTNISDMDEKSNTQSSGTERKSARNTQEITRRADVAEEFFGTTKKDKEAGYITVNGKMLDFSGRHWGDPTGGSRQVDHRDVWDAFEDPDQSGTEAMIDFMRDGNIRLIPETNGINLQSAPNAEQVKALRGYIMNRAGEIMIDIDDESGRTINSFSYNRGTAPARILGDLKAYFEDGTMPAQQSSLAQFRFSNRTGELSDADLLKMARDTVAQTDTERSYLKMYDEAMRKVMILNDSIESYRDAAVRARNQGDAAKANSMTREVELMRKQLDAAVKRMSDLEASEPLTAVMYRIRHETEEAVLEAMTKMRDDAGDDDGPSTASIEEALKKQARAYQLEIVTLKDRIKQEQKKTQEALKGADSTKRRGRAPDTKKLIDKYETRIHQLEIRLAAVDNGSAKKLAQEVKKRDNAIKDMRDRRKASETRQKIRRIIDNFNQRLAHPRANRYVPADMILGIVQALESFDLSYVRGGEEVVSKSVRDMYDVYDRYKEDGEYTFYNKVIAGKLEQLAQEMGGVKFRNMRSEQLQKVYEVMQSLHKVVTEAVQFKALEGYKDAIEAGDKAISQVQEAAPMVKGKAGEILNWMSSPDNFFKRISGFAKDSVLVNMQRQFVAGEQKMLEVQRDYVNTFADYTKTESFENLNKHAEGDLVDVGLKNMDANEDGEHNPILITRGMMLALYMHLQSEDNIRGIARGGLTIPNLTRYYEKNPAAAFNDEKAYRTAGVKQRTAGMMDGLIRAHMESGMGEINARMEAYKDLQAMEDAEVGELQKLANNIYEMMTDDEKGMIQAAHTWFDQKSRTYLNEISMDLYGFKVAAVDKYFPIHRDSNFLNTQFQSISNDASLANMGFLKERVKASQPILLTDFAYEMASSADMTSRYVGFAKAERDFNLLYRAQLPGMTTSLREQIGKKFHSGDKKVGVTGMQYIDNYVNDIIGNNRSKQTIWDDIRSNLARSTLTLNPRVALSQAASIPTAVAELDLASVASALKDVGIAFDRKAKDQLAQDDIWFWQRYRGQGGMTEFADAKKNGNKLDRAYNTVANTKVGKALMNWCQDFDVGATAIIHKATENWVTSHTGYAQGTDEWKQAVADKYRDVLRRTQPMYMTTARSDVMRSSDAIMKTFTMFKTQASQNLNTLYNASAEFRKFKTDLAEGKNGVTAEDVKQARDRYMNSIAGVGMGAVAYAFFRFLVNAMMGKLRKYKDDETDEMTVMSTVKGIGLEAVSSLSSMVVFGDAIWSAGESIVTGGKYYGVNETAVGQVSELAESIVDMSKAVGTDKFGKKAAEVFSDLAGLTGIPADNMKNVANMVTYYFSGMTHGIFDSETTDNQMYNRVIGSMLEGDDAGYERGLAEEMQAAGKTLKQAQAGLKNRITYWYENGAMSRDEAIRLLTGDKLQLDANDVFWLLDKSDYKRAHGGKTDGYSQTRILEDAIKGGSVTDIESAIEYYKSHGFIAKPQNAVKAAVKNLYENDAIDWETASNLMVRYGGYTTDDKKLGTTADSDGLFWLKEEWDYNKSGEATLSEGSYTKYTKLDDALNSLDVANAQEQVEYLMSHGVKKGSIASHLAGAFKETYLEMLDVDPVAAEQYLSGVILPIYKAAGYTEAQERKYIAKKWK